MEMALNEQANAKSPPIGMDKLFFTRIRGHETGARLAARIVREFQPDRMAKIFIRLFIHRV
jgi:hypothetical protein